MLAEMGNQGLWKGLSKRALKKGFQITIRNAVGCRNEYIVLSF